MALKVHYSIRAIQEQVELLEFIQGQFGQTKARAVFERIEKVLLEIAEMPEMYRSSGRRNGLRKCVFSKQTSIYYRVHSDSIEVVSFRPTRMNPKKFKV